MGVWVTVEAETEYIKNCFEEYNAHTDPSGRYFTLYKRWHLIGLEVGVSVASVALRGEPTGVATCWNADVVATAKRDLAPGELLDGEGGYTVWGKLLPAATSVHDGRPAAGPGARRQGGAAGEEGPEPVLGRRGDGHHHARVQDPQGNGGDVRRARAEGRVTGADCAVVQFGVGEPANASAAKIDLRPTAAIFFAKIRAAVGG